MPKNMWFKILQSSILDTTLTDLNKSTFILSKHLKLIYFNGTVMHSTLRLNLHTNRANEHSINTFTSQHHYQLLSLTSFKQTIVTIAVRKQHLQEKLEEMEFYESEWNLKLNLQILITICGHCWPSWPTL